MIRKKNYFAGWVCMFVLPFVILTLSHSSVHAQWTRVAPQGVSGNWELVGAHFTSTDEGWVVGRDLGYSEGVLLHYQSGTWTSVAPPAVSSVWQLNDVYFTSANEGWAVGYNSTNTRGVLLHYQGGTWTSVTPPTVSGDWLLRGVHFTSANEGWAVGLKHTGGDAVLLHYQDGTWTSVTPPSLTSNWWYLNGVHFTSANEGWASGVDLSNASGVLLHYQNGTWTSVTPTPPSDYWYLGMIHFTSADEGWAVGEDNTNAIGVLLHYQSGTWTPIPPPTLLSSWWNLAGVHFTSANEGWAVGRDYANRRGVLLHYQSGTWTSVTPPTVSNEWHVWGVHFTSPDDGWAVGWDSTNNQELLLHYGALSPSAVLTIDKSGNGTGTVTSDPGGISCGSECTDTYDTGTVVTLTAFPDTDSTFTGWSGGGCSGTETCEVTMSSDISVTATFMLVGSLPELSPVAGTIGTEMTITGTGFGTKKGKVLIGGAATKIINWSPNSITGEMKKLLSPGIAYDVDLQPKEPKGVAPIRIPGAFTMMTPEISSLEPASGATPDEIVVSGNYFGTKKGKVSIEGMSKGKPKKTNCKVTFWFMDPTTGAGELRFLVPKGLDPGAYPLTVTNKIGSASRTFTITTP